METLFLTLDDIAALWDWLSPPSPPPRLLLLLGIPAYTAFSMKETWLEAHWSTQVHRLLPGCFWRDSDTLPWPQSRPVLTYLLAVLCGAQDHGGLCSLENWANSSYFVGRFSPKLMRCSYMTRKQQILTTNSLFIETQLIGEKKKTFCTEHGVRDLTLWGVFRKIDFSYGL